jgi:hypothetical protein
LEARFELNKLAENVDDFRDEFEEENRQWDKVRSGDKENSREVQSSVEFTEAEFVNKMLEIIENSPDVQFLASGRGKVTAQTTNLYDGFKGFRFDSKSKNMIRITEEWLEELLDNPKVKVPIEDEKEGMVQFMKYERGDYFYIVKRYPFRPQNNPSMYVDFRPGQHFTSAICYKKDYPSSLDDENMKQELEKPNAKFFDDLLNACAEKYIPDYYHFVHDK